MEIEAKADEFLTQGAVLYVDIAEDGTRIVGRLYSGSPLHAQEKYLGVAARDIQRGGVLKYDDSMNTDDVWVSGLVVVKGKF
jgi:hypothetical protein